MKNFDSIMNKLIQGENEKCKCPYCWSKIIEKNDHYYCDECEINVEGDNYELI